MNDKSHTPARNQPNINDILTELYDRYYLNHHNFSDVTSSYWRKYGEFQRVIKTSEGFSLSGVGFGYYEASGRKRFYGIHRIPMDLYIQRMLRNCNEKIIDAGKWFLNRTGFDLSYDLARHLLTIDLLSRQIEDLDNRKICIIGDGYGVMGCLLKKLFPNTSITQINLGRTLFFDVYFTLKCFPSGLHRKQCSSEELLNFDFRYVEAETINFQSINASVFINIASMQEMNREVIGKYFEIIRAQKQPTYFYCCNRKSKELPDGTIINFDDYGWLDTDEILFDGPCPWHQRFPITRPPFIKRFDGPVQHRLIRIN